MKTFLDNQLIVPEYEFKLLTPEQDPMSGYSQEVICEDDPQWTYGDKTCIDYSLRNSNCSEVGDNGETAYKSCRVSCDTCPGSLSIQKRKPSPLEDIDEPDYSLFKTDTDKVKDKADSDLMDIPPVDSRAIYAQLDDLDQKISDKLGTDCNDEYNACQSNSTCNNLVFETNNDHKLGFNTQTFCGDNQLCNKYKQCIQNKFFADNLTSDNIQNIYSIKDTLNTKYTQFADIRPYIYIILIIILFCSTFFYFKLHKIENDAHKHLYILLFIIIIISFLYGSFKGITEWNENKYISNIPIFIILLLFCYFLFRFIESLKYIQTKLKENQINSDEAPEILNQLFNKLYNRHPSEISSNIIPLLWGGAIIMVVGIILTSKLIFNMNNIFIGASWEGDSISTCEKIPWSQGEGPNITCGQDPENQINNCNVDCLYKKNDSSDKYIHFMGQQDDDQRDNITPKKNIILTAILLVIFTLIFILFGVLGLFNRTSADWDDYQRNKSSEIPIIIFTMIIICMGLIGSIIGIWGKFMTINLLAWSSIAAGVLGVLALLRKDTPAWSAKRRTPLCIGFALLIMGIIASFILWTPGEELNHCKSPLLNIATAQEGKSNYIKKNMYNKLIDDIEPFVEPANRPTPPSTEDWTDFKPEGGEYVELSTFIRDMEIDFIQGGNEDKLISEIEDDINIPHNIDRIIWDSDNKYVLQLRFDNEETGDSDAKYVYFGDLDMIVKRFNEPIYYITKEAFAGAIGESLKAYQENKICNLRNLDPCPPRSINKNNLNEAFKNQSIYPLILLRNDEVEIYNKDTQNKGLNQIYLRIKGYIYNILAKNTGENTGYDYLYVDFKDLSDKFIPIINKNNKWEFNELRNQFHILNNRINAVASNIPSEDFNFNSPERDYLGEIGVTSCDMYIERNHIRDFWLIYALILIIIFIFWYNNSSIKLNLNTSPYETIIRNVGFGGGVFIIIIIIMIYNAKETRIEGFDEYDESKWNKLNSPLNMNDMNDMNDISIESESGAERLKRRNESGDRNISIIWDVETSGPCILKAVEPEGQPGDSGCTNYIYAKPQLVQCKIKDIVAEDIGDLYGYVIDDEHCSGSDRPIPFITDGCPPTVEICQGGGGSG